MNTDYLLESLHVEIDRVVNNINTDHFYINIYNYYRNHGFINIITKSITNILSYIFSTIIMLHLIFFIKWDLLLYSAKYRDIMYYIQYEKPFNNIFFLIYLIFNLINILYELTIFVYKIRNVIPTKHYYNNVLGLSDDCLDMLSWDDITSKIVSLNYGIISDEEKIIYSDHINARIMRKTNYIMQIHRHIIPITSDTVELIIDKLVVSNILDGEQLTNNIILTDRKILKIIYTYGIIYTLLFPIIVCNYVLNFVIKNIQEWYHNKKIFGPRCWTKSLLMTFRHYNELPHMFSTRIYNSYPLIIKYQNTYHNYSVNTLNKFFTFIFGLCASICLIISLVNENALLELEFHDKTILWYLTLFSTLFTVFRSMIFNDKYCENIIQIREKIHTDLENVLGIKLHENIAELFKCKLQIFMNEIYHLFKIPLYLFVIIPKNINKIVEFVIDNTIHIDTLGDIINNIV
jgi:autophagy-related protein 9